MISRAFSSVLLLLATSAETRAGTLATGLIPLGSAQTHLECQATNVGAKPVKVISVSLVGVDGTPLAGDHCANVAFGGICTVTTSTPASCQIEFTGSKQSIRGAAFVPDATFENIVLVEPAR